MEERALDRTPATDTAVVGVIVKVTWTGEQSESVPTVAFSNVRVPSLRDIELFVPSRTPRVHYGNDDTESNGRFLVSDGEMLAVLRVIEDRDWPVTLEASSAWVSISWARFDTSSRFEFARELLFDAKGGEEIVAAMLASLDHEDGPRRFLGDMHRYLRGD